jgi:hypothetical protein
MSVCLVTVEGVLGEHSTLHGFHPIVEGVRLVRAMHSEYQIMFSTTQSGYEAVDYWLRINGMMRPTFYEDLLYRTRPWTDLTDVELQTEHAHHLRTTGADVGMVVSADPETILRITRLGFPSVFFVNPTYRWAEYRPDHKRLPRPWQEIDDEMVRQRELKATDPRLNEMEEA